MNKFIKYTILLCFSLCCCVNAKDVRVKGAITPEQAEAAFCQDGCNHLQKLRGQDGKDGCEESRPLRMHDGRVVSCADFCKETQLNGRELYPSCWIKVESCEEIETYRAQEHHCY